MTKTDVDKNKPMVRVITKDSDMREVPCGYTPNVVREIRFRISNILALALQRERELGGYADDAEFVKEAIREKILKDELARTQLAKLQKDAY